MPWGASHDDGQCRTRLASRIMPPFTRRQKIWAMLHMRCPRCCRGKIYQSRSRMHQRCPVCDLLFHREPGYFLGALYISYGASCIVLMLALLAASLLFPDVDL